MCVSFNRCLDDYVSLKALIYSKEIILYMELMFCGLWSNIYMVSSSSFIFGSFHLMEWICTCYNILELEMVNGLICTIHIVTNYNVMLGWLGPSYYLLNLHVIFTISSLYFHYY